MDYERFGQTLKDARRNAGMSAREVAEATGGVVSRGMIANWESGRKASLDISELTALAEAVGVPPLSLLYPIGDRPDEAIQFSGYEDDTYRVLYRWSDLNLLSRLTPPPPDLAQQWRQFYADARRAGWDIENG